MQLIIIDRLSLAERDYISESDIKNVITDRIE